MALNGSREPYPLESCSVDRCRRLESQGRSLGAESWVGCVFVRTLNRADGRVGTPAFWITTLEPFGALKGARDALCVVLRFAFLPTGTEVRGKTLERRWTRRPRGIL